MWLYWVSRGLWVKCDFICVYSPPQCSVAGTGWCQRGRGWQWWCGRSWQGWGPTGNPGSQRPASLKPTPKGQEEKEKRQMLSGSHRLWANCVSCCDSELQGTLWGCQSYTVHETASEKMAAHINTLPTCAIYFDNIYSPHSNWPTILHWVSWHEQLDDGSAQRWRLEVL